MPQKGILETMAEEAAAPRHPWETTLAMAFVGGAVLGGVVFVVGFAGGLALYQGSNLAPIWGILLGPPAFLVGLIAGALISRSGWSYARSLSLLAGLAGVLGLALFSYLWIHRTQDDSEILADRVDKVADRLSRSGRTEEVLVFQPPREAGPYTIAVDGGESWSLSVDYPRTARGHGWGQGRAWARPHLRVPVTLSKDKAAGESTELVLRRHGAGVELAELR